MEIARTLAEAPGGKRDLREMDFALADERKLIIKTAKAFAEKGRRPRGEQVEKTGPPGLVCLRAAAILGASP